jgi:hypothetical protein
MRLPANILFVYCIKQKNTTRFDNLWKKFPCGKGSFFYNQRQHEIIVTWRDPGWLAGSIHK